MPATTRVASRMATPRYQRRTNPWPKPGNQGREQRGQDGDCAAEGLWRSCRRLEGSRPYFLGLLAVDLLELGPVDFFGQAFEDFTPSLRAITRVA